MAFKLEFVIGCDSADCPDTVTFLAVDMNEANASAVERGWYSASGLSPITGERTDTHFCPDHAPDPS